MLGNINCLLHNVNQPSIPRMLACMFWSLHSIWEQADSMLGGVAVAMAPNYLLWGYHREKPRAVFRNNSPSTLFTWTFQFLNKTLHKPEIEPSAHCTARSILSLKKLNKYFNICFSISYCTETTVCWEVGGLLGWLASELFVLWFLFFSHGKTRKVELCLGRDSNSFGCLAETVSAARLSCRNGKAPTELHQQCHTFRVGDRLAASAFSWTTEGRGSSADIEEVLRSP